MNESTQHQNPPRTTPAAVLWLMSAVVVGGSWLLISVPAEPAGTLARVEMPQLHGSAAHRGGVITAGASAASARTRAEATSMSDALQVAALQAP